MTNTGHALLSPSSAHRWLNCTRAPRLEETLPEKTTKYAAEGTLAHSVCEIMAKLRFKKISKNEYSENLEALKQDPLWDNEMIKTAETYIEHLQKNYMSYKHFPYIAFETKVNLANYVPESFGRCDCIIIGENTLIITDYKHGEGVSVKAEKNPQMMLYALGALDYFNIIYGNTIKDVKLCIDQPRKKSYDCWTCSTDELRTWGESIKIFAQMAFRGLGEFKAGDWCKFCRANGQCKAQAGQQLRAVDDFGSVVNQDRCDNSVEAKLNQLSPNDLANILSRSDAISEWLKSVKEYALKIMLEGTTIPGYKVVESSGGKRSWSDEKAALETLEYNGYKHEDLFEEKAKSLAALEKNIGVEKFYNLVGKFITKPQGKPTIAEESDKRKAFNSAAADFADVAQNDKSTQTF